MKYHVWVGLADPTFPEHPQSMSPKERNNGSQHLKDGWFNCSNGQVIAIAQGSEAAIVRQTVWLCPSRPTQYCSPMDPVSCSSCPGGALVDAGRRFSALKEKDLNWTPPIAALEAIGNLCAFFAGSKKTNSRHKQHHARAVRHKSLWSCRLWRSSVWPHRPCPRQPAARWRSETRSRPDLQC